MEQYIKNKIKETQEAIWHRELVLEYMADTIEDKDRDALVENNKKDQKFLDFLIQKCESLA